MRVRSIVCLCGRWAVCLRCWVRFWGGFSETLYDLTIRWGWIYGSGEYGSRLWWYWEFHISVSIFILWGLCVGTSLWVVEPNADGLEWGLFQIGIDDLVIASVLVSVLYAFLRWIPDIWWLVGTGFYISFSVLFSFLAPVVILPLFNPFEPLENGALEERVRLVVSGWNYLSGVIAGAGGEDQYGECGICGYGKQTNYLSDTLKGYSEEEILAVVARSGDCRNGDMVRIMGVHGVRIDWVLCSGSIFAWIDRLGGVEFDFDIAGAPLFFFGLILFSMITMPVANGYSRQREFAADAYAVDTLGSADALVAALEKLLKQNLSVREPNRWVVKHSHPSLKRRVERARLGR